MFPISLVTITKDEEDVIERLLESAKTIVSEMIVVDTGSMDRTTTIADKHGCKVFSFEWSNDFSAAKNFGIKQASERWILVLDADEWIVYTNPLVLKDMLRKDTVWSLKSFHEFDRGNETLEQVVYQPRLFPNRVQYKYHGRIHEELRCNNQPITTTRTDEFRFRHDGYRKERVVKKNKIDRNVHIHLQEHESEPTNYRHLLRAAKTCYHANEYQLAKELYTQILDVELPTKAVMAEIIVDYGNVCHQLNAPDEGIHLLMQNIESIQECTDIWYVLGLLFLAKKEMKYLSSAITCFNKCLQVGEMTTEYNNTIGTGSYLPSYNLGLIYEVLGQKETALSYLGVSANYGYKNAVNRIQAISVE